MRIIGGKHKGRRFTPPADNWPTRPTTDYAKEGLFNILQNNFDLEELKVLDLFGGTGNHSYEFASRGCCDITYVDRFAGAIKFVRGMVEKLDMVDCIKIVQADVFKYIRRAKGKQYDYIFLGPPYGMPALDTLPDEVFEADLLAPGGWMVLEHNPNHDFTKHPRFDEARNYGKTIFSFFDHG